MKPPLIGLVGFARAGKNSFAEFFGKSTVSSLNCKYISFAYALRKELDNFLQQRLNISAFTEDPEEKEIIRPLLVCWATEIMREKIDRDHWVKSIEKTVEINRKNNICSIITDVRFKNEILWMQPGEFAGDVAIVTKTDDHDKLIGKTNENSYVNLYKWRAIFHD